MRDLWTSARSLWIKFCGIADEYKMLRDRWLYLYNKDKLPVLPYLRAENPDEEKQTFDLLDDHVEELETKFGELGFDRNRMESYNDFRQEASGTNRVDIVDKLKLIEDYVYDLANFVGLLKFAFFQRTVSSEIPHVASGMPHSPERTIGNELFYLAADNVARRYYECLNIPYGKWDGFITFTPPITEGRFYGAFYRPSPFLKLFHVSMSEEAKYFVGSYLALAHEFAHGCVAIRHKLGSRSWIDKPLWFKLLTGLIWRYTTDLIKNKREEMCKNCPLYQLLFEVPDEYGELQNYPNLCEELISDIVACYIAGKNYLHSFLDSFTCRISLSPLSSPLIILLRTIPTVVYFDQMNFDVNDLKQRLKKLVTNVENCWEEKEYCPQDYFFSECIQEIGINWALLIKEFATNTSEYISENLEERFYDALVRLNRLRANVEELQFRGTINEIDEKLLEFSQKGLNNLRDLVDTQWENLFKVLVGEEFRINKEEEEMIIDSLIEGAPVSKEDPRHILHCYYEAYKQSEGEERPNYAATIYSLAFNTYNNKKKKRKS